jgi:hypothetical protein
MVVSSKKHICDVQNLVVNVYDKMYYKIYNSFDEDLETIENMLKSNTLMFPILNLLKLFIAINSKLSYKKVLANYNDLYQETKLYKSFFVGSLFDLLELVSLSFEEIIPNEEWIKNHNDVIAYHILSTKCYMNKNYIGTLFYSYLAMDMLLRDGNYNRLIYVNNNLIVYYMLEILKNVMKFQEDKNLV